MLGRALYTLGGSYYFFGDLRRALEVSARVEAIGEAMGDRRLQTQGASFKGWALAACGDWEAGILRARRLWHARRMRMKLPSTGDSWVMRTWKRVSMRQRCRCSNKPSRRQCSIGPHRCRAGSRPSLATPIASTALDQARDLAQQGLELARRIAHGWGAALAQRTLGRIAHSRGNLAEARPISRRPTTPLRRSTAGLS